MPELVLGSPFAGSVRDLATLEDPVFAGRIVGDGVAVEPAGVVAKVFPGGHGIALETDAGPVLIHVGIDTVELKGEGFVLRTEDGARVAAGDPLVEVDVAAVRARGFATVTPVLAIGGQRVVPEAPVGGPVATGEALFRIVSGP